MHGVKRDDGRVNGANSRFIRLEVAPIQALLAPIQEALIREAQIRARTQARIQVQILALVAEIEEKTNEIAVIVVSVVVEVPNYEKESRQKVMKKDFSEGSAVGGFGD